MPNQNDITRLPCDLKDVSCKSGGNGSCDEEEFTSEDRNELLRIILAFLVLAICFLLMLTATGSLSKDATGKEVVSVCPKHSR